MKLFNNPSVFIYMFLAAAAIAVLWYLGFLRADKIRREYVGNDVHLRGLTESKAENKGYFIFKRSVLLFCRACHAAMGTYQGGSRSILFPSGFSR